MWILICKFSSVFHFVYIIIYCLILWHVIFIFFCVAAVTTNCYLRLKLEYVSCNILVHIIHSTIFKNHNNNTSHLKFNFSLSSVSQWFTFSFLVYSCEIFLFSRTFWNIVITVLVYFFIFLWPSIFLPLFCCLRRMFVMKQLLIFMMHCCEWLSLNTSHRVTWHWGVSDHTRHSFALFMHMALKRRRFCCSQKVQQKNCLEILQLIGLFFLHITLVSANFHHDQ